jgi:hypothetical protein
MHQPPGTPCDGWWQQAGYGRQPMRDLQLEFSSGQITGSGADIIGQFTFRGTLDPAGRVQMIKQYVGLWSVDYIGTYDGEGLLFGHWRVGGLTDEWLIRLKPPSRVLIISDEAASLMQTVISEFGERRDG